MLDILDEASDDEGYSTDENEEQIETVLPGQVCV